MNISRSTTSGGRPKSDVSVVISRSSSFTGSPAAIPRSSSHAVAGLPNFSSSTSISNRVSNGHASSSRIPYADKGKWPAKEKNTYVDTDEEYIGLQNNSRQNGVHKSKGKGKERQSAVKGHHIQNGQPGSSSHIISASSRSLTQLDDEVTSASDHSMDLDASATFGKSSRKHTQHTPEPPPLQAVMDRPPPTPPPLPEISAQPWYFLYAPEVAWAKLEPKQEEELKHDIEYLSEGSQGRASASKTTITSIGALSRTPSKNRMRMVPANIRARSRSRRGTHAGGHDSDSSASYRRHSSPEEEAESSDDESVEDVSPVSSSESDSDREETDGTDTEVEELIEFKKATRTFAEITHGTLRGSSAADLYVVTRRKRMPFLEETLPDTYGPRYPAQTARIVLEAAKPGLGPRAVARKSFARAIGARLLSTKRRAAAK